MSAPDHPAGVRMPGAPAPEDRVVALQAELSRRLEGLRAHPPGTEGYTEAAHAVLAATTDLVDFEERLPILRDAPYHRRSLLTVRGTGAGLAAVSALLGVAAITGAVARPWLLPLIVFAAAGWRMLRLPVHPPTGPHTEQRLGALVAAVAAPLLVVAVTGLTSAWLVVPAGLLVAGGVVLMGRRPVPGTGDGESEGSTAGPGANPGIDPAGGGDGEPGVPS